MLHSAEKPDAARGPVLRLSAAISFLLGFAGLGYWLPAVLLDPAAAGSGSSHPAALINRVAVLALEQYTPQMRWTVPVLGVLFCLVSAVQVPAAVGVFLGRPRALPWLVGVSYTKLALFVASGLLLGLAVFSSVRAGDPSWTFSAGTWIADLVMIGIYYAIIRAISPPLSGFDDPGELDELEDMADEEEAPEAEPETAAAGVHGPRG